MVRKKFNSMSEKLLDSTTQGATTNAVWGGDAAELKTPACHAGAPGFVPQHCSTEK